MHHRHPPTGWSGWEGPLRPRAFDLAKIGKVSASPWDAAAVLGNAHMRLRLWRAEGAMDHLVRNSDGDELIFVHAGQGQLFCDYGRLEFGEGDYVMVPRGTMWRIEAEGAAVLLMIEATNDGYRLPDKGMVGAHAIFDPAMLKVPAIDEAFLAQQDESVWRVRIKRSGAVSTVTYPFNPLDAVGWHGKLAPV
jgi:homogentisate 1,2-dioxygenase